MKDREPDWHGVRQSGQPAKCCQVLSARLTIRVGLLMHLCDLATTSKMQPPPVMTTPPPVQYDHHQQWSPPTCVMQPPPAINTPPPVSSDDPHAQPSLTENTPHVLVVYIGVIIHVVDTRFYNIICFYAYSIGV